MTEGEVAPAPLGAAAPGTGWRAPRGRTGRGRRRRPSDAAAVRGEQRAAQGQHPGGGDGKAKSRPGTSWSARQPARPPRPPPRPPLRPGRGAASGWQRTRGAHQHSAAQHHQQGQTSTARAAVAGGSQVVTNPRLAAHEAVAAAGTPTDVADTAPPSDVGEPHALEQPGAAAATTAFAGDQSGGHARRPAQGDEPLTSSQGRGRSKASLRRARPRRWAARRRRPAGRRSSMATDGHQPAAAAGRPEGVGDDEVAVEEQRAGQADDPEAGRASPGSRRRASPAARPAATTVPASDSSDHPGEAADRIAAGQQQG